MEMEYREYFDHIIINDDLQETLAKATAIVNNALSNE
jgi:guanylate kinase